MEMMRTLWRVYGVAFISLVSSLSSCYSCIDSWYSKKVRGTILCWLDNCGEKQKYGKTEAKSLHKKAFEFYLPRLVGTGGNWFVWDITFYGLKLYSGPIFEDINPGGDLIVQNGYLLLNNICALAGYYVVAKLIDRYSIGRKKIQMFSFGMCAFLFMLTAGVFNSAPTGAIIFLFFATSFIGQGVNVTTYVIAAEMYPTELRGTFHGLSAFLGKLGALFATIIFGYLTTEQIFWVCGGCAIAGICLHLPVYGRSLSCITSRT